MTPSFRLLPALMVGAGVLLAGCDRIGNPFEAIRGSVPAPDEFAVIKRKPLQMPPSLGLPPPQPGAPSPLDPRPREEAAMALLGTPASARGQQRQLTAGEAALLDSADAAAASDEVRVQLARQRQRERETYQPPTIFEVLGVTNAPEVDDAERLEPVTESQRLQRTGVPAPADPLARPPEEGEQPLVQPEEGVRVFTAPRATGRP